MHTAERTGFGNGLTKDRENANGNRVYRLFKGRTKQNPIHPQAVGGANCSGRTGNRCNQGCLCRPAFPRGFDTANPCKVLCYHTIARVDHLYWNSDFSMDGYTESERVFISYVSRETKKHEPIHHLEYFLDIACSPHIQTRAMLKEDFFEEK